ncbi:hypothetical protein ACFOOK_26435 [Micromonospora krabiensis]|uniref:Uncharacterized protein n=1 Tax=Micromonospora krabiensis TaxID=307121 RepID=A0A1C3N5P3_9ACTN|nr:hypothetical protein [Micromonospora krabiensis]SBV27894.1 hypothetical protein GA0070620_3425 [Micromonospora krabiensis]
MFPGATATVYHNEAGEPLGWDTYSGYDEPYAPEDYCDEDDYYYDEDDYRDEDEEDE